MKHIIEIGQDGDWYVYKEGFESYDAAKAEMDSEVAKHPEWKQYRTELRVTPSR